MEDSLSLRVVVCAYRDVCSYTAASLLSLAKTFPGLEFALYTGMNTPEARIAAVKACEEDYLLFVDSDIVFTLNDFVMILDTLIKNPDLGALSALYYKWSNDAPIAGWLQEDGEWLPGDKVLYRVDKYKKKKAVEEVDSAGAGFLLIDTKVFEDLEEPWFVLGPGMTEDTYFLQKIKEKGFKPSIHFGVEVGHIGPKIVGGGGYGINFS